MMNLVEILPVIIEKNDLLIFQSFDLNRDMNVI